jgi:large conductance mechanosensitive channel
MQRRQTVLKSFRDFAMRGNMIDLAVGVIIGGAFGKIVSSLVGDILTPLLGLLLGGIDFSGQSLKIGDAVVAWGAFMQAIIDFAIIAFVIFLIVKGISRLQRKPAPADPTTKECPRCFSTISIKATRCPNCTSELK